jgi:hypothetical protein
VQAPAPSRPIDRGLAGPGLLAHVLVSKYADHVPLYRQSEIYAREGVDLDRSTLAGWVGATSELLTPLVQAVRDHVLAASKLHADDTPEGFTNMSKVCTAALAASKRSGEEDWPENRDSLQTGYDLRLWVPRGRS